MHRPFFIHILLQHRNWLLPSIKRLKEWILQFYCNITQKDGSFFDSQKCSHLFKWVPLSAFTSFIMTWLELRLWAFGWESCLVNINNFNWFHICADLCVEWINQSWKSKLHFVQQTNVFKLIELCVTLKVARKRKNKKKRNYAMKCEWRQKHTNKRVQNVADNIGLEGVCHSENRDFSFLFDQFIRVSTETHSFKASWVILSNSFIFLLCVCSIQLLWRDLCTDFIICDTKDKHKSKRSATK